MIIRLSLRVIIIASGIVSLLADSPSRSGSNAPREPKIASQSAPNGCQPSIIYDTIIDERDFNCGEYFYLGLPREGSARSWDIAVFVAKLESFATNLNSNVILNASTINGVADFTQVSWNLPIAKKGSQKSGFLVIKKPVPSVLEFRWKSSDRGIAEKIDLQIPPKELHNSESKFSAIDIRVLRQKGDNELYTFVGIAFNKEIDQSKFKPGFVASSLLNKIPLVQNWQIIGNMVFGAFQGNDTDTVIEVKNIVSNDGEAVDLNSFEDFNGLPFEIEAVP
ncbi:MAG: hypothetical protein NT027_14380 [Proteobacteria bacterium]|nr:hypothetical protein [Pseudomonadota bacterium]